MERICSKALAKRASERYSTAFDLADDLRHFLQVEGGSLVAGGGWRVERGGRREDKNEERRHRFNPPLTTLYPPRLSAEVIPVYLEATPFSIWLNK